MVSVEEIGGAFVIVGAAVGGTIVLIRKMGLRITKNNENGRIKDRLVTFTEHKELVEVVKQLGETQIRQGEILLNHGERLAEAKATRQQTTEKLEKIGKDIAVLLDRSLMRRKEDL